MGYNKFLEKLVNKHFSDRDLKDDSLKKFLKAVNNKFNAFESELQFFENAYETNETRLLEINAGLTRLLEKDNRSFIHLKNVLLSFDPTLSVLFKEDEDDITGIISILEDQLQKTRQLERELTAAKEKAELLANTKSEFLSTMSHEIRTPLNAIIGSMNVLKEYPLSAEQQEIVDIMRVSSENLVNLLNDVLDFSKLEEKKMLLAKEPFSLIQLLKHVKLVHSIRAKENGNTIKLICDEKIPDYVSGDEIRLGQVINNLVNNAIKFTRGGQVIIRVDLENQVENSIKLKFSVSDTGIGIAKEQQNLIFDRYMQVSGNPRQDQAGSGLGLNIVKQILDMHHSEIYVNSTPGKGSEFYFSIWFEISQPTEPLNHQALNNTNDLHGLSVLLAEDMNFNVVVIERMLQKWNAQIDVARNGKEAVEKAKLHSYDAILMDIQMPVMDGYDAAKEIRLINDYTPIIALTASISLEVQAKIRNTGMNDFISKPFNPQSLFKALNKYVPHKV